jgi:hypothetical protein
MAHTAYMGGRHVGFARHAVEMVVVMFVGMAVLGAVEGAVLALAGISTRDLVDDAPAVAALGMAFNMALPMTLWMFHRGHSRARGLEMGLAMFAPGVVAVVLLATTAIEGGAVCGFECMFMLPLMLSVMWLRRADYG